MSESVQTGAFSFSDVWNDTVAMLRGNAGLLTAVAGVFLFLPPLLLARLLPEPEEWLTPEQFIASLQTYYEGSWHWLLLGQLVTMVGVAAIYALLLAQPRMTVGRALGRALAVLPFYYVLTIIWNLMVGLGMLLLVVPGIYLLGRLALAFPILVVDKPTAPISALRQAWTVTGDRAWAAAGLIIIVSMAAVFLTVIATVTIGSLLLLIGGGQEGVGGLLVAILGAFMQAGAALVSTGVFAGLYRAMMQRTDMLSKTFD